MKALLALLALFAVAPAAHAQTVDTKSDAYICYHGNADDPRTNAACERVQAQASQPVAPVAPPPVAKGDANAAQNGASLAVTPNPSSPGETKAEAPAAKPAPPTDVGEAPLNVQAGADEVNADEGDNDVHVHGGWLAGLFGLGVVAATFLIFGFLAIHFIPTIIAIARRKRNAVWIFLVNLFLGWTIVGWVWALVWSLMTDPV